MVGSNARCKQGPPGWSRAAPFVLAAVLLASCAAPAAPLPATSPSRPVAPDAGRLDAAGDAMRGPAADSFAAVAMRAAGLTPLFGPGFVTPGRDGAVVAGVLPGGHPVHRDTLVVVVGVGAAGAAAVLEAAHLLSARSAFTAGPARSVMAAVAFDPASRPLPGAAAAAAAVLAAPLWSPESVVSLVTVGQGAEAAAPAATDRGLTFVPVAGADAAALAMGAFEALQATSRAPSPPVRSIAADSAAVQSGR
jgi:hypothetical protein